jgi:mRNA interferase RelE/StbE
MARYSVEIIPKAGKEYLKLPESAKLRLRELILSLETEQRPIGAKKLRETDYYRIRSGDYRIVYSIDDKARLIKILSIGHLKEIYRSL